MAPNRWIRALVLAGLALARAAAPCAAENRVEGLSTGHSIGHRPVELIEMDLQVGRSLGGAFGMRSTALGSRDTYEIYGRKTKEKTRGARDPRDNRTAVKEVTRNESAFHLGLVGVDFEGERNQPQSVRAGLSSVVRTGPGSSAVAEVDYQTGTFGGDGTGVTNSAGIFSRVGLRHDISKSFYAVGDYSFSPGDRPGWTPQLRVGFSF